MISTMAPVTAEFPLPAVQKALSPFLHTRADILLVRRQLASLLASSQQQQQQQPSLTSIRADTHASGIRKRYLQAVKDNQAAQSEWQVAVSKANQPAPPEKPETQDSWAHAYDQVLDLRRRYESLVILKEHLSSIQKDEQTSTSSWSGLINISLPPTPTTLANTVDTTTDDDLLLPLEKAVVTAASELETERTKLDEVTGKSPDGAGGNTLHALRVTKAALDNWVDEHLTLAGDGFQPPPKPAEQVTSLDSHLSEITAVYDDYVYTRQALITSASQPRTLPSDTPISETASSTPKTQSLPIQISPLLPHLSALFATHHRTRDLHTVTSSLTATMSTSSTTLSASMDRLRSESRLLDSYPSRPASHPGVKAWEFAASEGRRAMMEEVKSDVEAAKGTLEKIEEKIVLVSGLVEDKGVWTELK